MERRTFIQVTVPLRLEWEPWYSAPEGMHAGQRVRVRLGRGEYVGVVHRVSVSPEELDPSAIVPIEGIEEDLADVTPEELQLWEFIADYYLCTIGEVYKAAYPESKTKSEKSGAKALRKKFEGFPSIQKKHSRTSGGAKPEFYGSNDRLAFYEKITEETDGDVLILVPDLASLDLMERRLRPAHPEMLVYDSRKTPAKRRRIDEILRYEEGRRIILGTRISIFLPFRNLGLIIIDDEQDTGYKQDEPAPRYNGRDCAVMLGHIHGARVIAGSSSPSLETIYNCLKGKYKKLPGGITTQASETEIIDIEAEFRKNGMTGPFSRRLLAEIAAYQGPVVIIRGWEDAEDICRQSAELFPGKEISVLRYREAREKELSYAFVAVLQADALVGRDDFRADEKALQAVSFLASRCRRLTVQTATPSRFDGSRGWEELLRERKEFGFPPYTRLVEIKTRGDKKTVQRYFLKPDGTLAGQKKEIFEKTPRNRIIDVDPQ